MNVALRKCMTLEQFLAWEIRQELRYEFDGANPVAMNGVRVEHAIIESNLNAALRDRLKGTPCRLRYVILEQNHCWRTGLRPSRPRMDRRDHQGR